MGWATDALWAARGIVELSDEKEDLKSLAAMAGEGALIGITDILSGMHAISGEPFSEENPAAIEIEVPGIERVGALLVQNDAGVALLFEDDRLLGLKGGITPEDFVQIAASDMQLRFGEKIVLRLYYDPAIPLRTEMSRLDRGALGRAAEARGEMPPMVFAPSYFWRDGRQDLCAGWAFCGDEAEAGGGRFLKVCNLFMRRCEFLGGARYPASWRG
jgi:hypothetical protein